MAFMWIIMILGVVSVSVLAESSDDVLVKRSVLLLPVANLTGNGEYAYLSHTIFYVLENNLRKQDSLNLFIGDEGTLALSRTRGFGEFMKAVEIRYAAETCVFGDYYTEGEELHITVIVADVATLRIKNCFSEVMPVDQERNEYLDEMCRDIAVTIAAGLPALAREAIMEKQIVNRLRARLDAEETLLDSILRKRNEVAVSTMTGISLGRSVITWSRKNSLAGFPLRIEYTRYLSGNLHMRAGLEYIPLDIMVPGVFRNEAGLDLLLGIHTPSLFSFSLDTGFAVTFDYNEECLALAESEYEPGPTATRLTFSLPLVTGFSLYLNRMFFLCFRFSSFGLSWTLETADPREYEYGSRSLSYVWGFSPFSFLCLSLTASFGVRF